MRFTFDQRMVRQLLALVAISAALVIIGAPLSPDQAVAAGVNEYSSPVWYPLRESAILKCANGTPECGGYHGYEALDLGGSKGDPVYAAGAGQAFIFRDLPDTPTGCISTDLTRAGELRSRIPQLGANTPNSLPAP